MLSAAELSALGLSVEVALLAALFGLPPAVAVAYFLSRTRWPGRSVVTMIAHAPLVLPPVVIGYLLLLLFGVRGPIGAWLQDWFGIRLVFTTSGAVLAASVMAFPLMVRAIKLSLDAVDHKLELAAASLGSPPWDVFRSITLPLMAPGILAALIIGFAASLGEFGATITFAANVDGATRTLPLAIYTAIQTPDGDAAAFRLVIVSISLALAALALSDWAERRARKIVYGA
jgi:molybdate transport system permease protein